MTHRKDKKLLARIKRIRGQVDAIERSLAGDTDCADEDHIREHMMQPSRPWLPSHEVAEDLIGLVRAYLK